MHATMLRVYRIMPCIEHPISGSICAELHGKWNNFKSSFVSSRLAADVIKFLENCRPVALSSFSIPHVIYHLCQSRNNFVFV